MATKACVQCGQQIPGFAQSCGYCGAMQGPPPRRDATPTGSGRRDATPTARRAAAPPALAPVVEPQSEIVPDAGLQVNRGPTDEESPGEAEPAAAGETTPPPPHGERAPQRLALGAGLPGRLFWMRGSQVGRAGSLRILGLVAGLVLVVAWVVPWTATSGGVTMSWDLLSDDGGFVSSGFIALYPLLAGVVLAALALVPGIPAVVWAGLLLVAGTIPLLEGAVVPQTETLQALVSSTTVLLLGVAILAIATAVVARKRETIAGRLLAGVGLLLVVAGFVVPQARLDNRPLLAALFRDLGEAPGRQVPMVLWGLLGFFASLVAPVTLTRPTRADDPVAPVARGLSWFYLLYVVLTPALMVIAGAEEGAPFSGLINQLLAAGKGVLLHATFAVSMVVGGALLVDALERGAVKATAQISRRRAARAVLARSVVPPAVPGAAGALAFGAAPLMVAAAGPAPATTAERRLVDLRGLLDKGLITQDEYTAKRTQILAEI